MRRKKPNGPNSDIHVFSTQFMTTLRSEGFKAVEPWVANKSINIFSKRLLFFPVHGDLHWSLCVVVNPGKFLTNYCGDDYMSNEEEDTL